MKQIEIPTESLFQCTVCAAHGSHNTDIKEKVFKFVLPKSKYLYRVKNLPSPY